MKRLVGTPGADPVTLDAVKEQLRFELDYTREDAHLETLIKAARAYAENYCDRAFITQTWRKSYQSWRDLESSVLPLGYLQSVDGISYIDADDTNQDLSNDSYRVDGIGTDEGRIVLTSGNLPFVTGSQKWVINVVFTCGYGDAPDNVPGDLRLALLFFIVHHWQHREASATFERTMDALLHNYRIKGVF